MKKNQKGQGMIEYILIVCLIAISSIAIIKVFGQNVKALFAKSAYRLQGEAGSRVRYEKVRSSHYHLKGLDDFDEE